MKKSFFRRITALLCCMTLCFVSFKPVANAASDTILTLNLGGLSIYTYEDVPKAFDDTTDINTFNKNELDGWEYAKKDNVMKIQASSGGDALVGSTVYFAIEASRKPTAAANIGTLVQPDSPDTISIVGKTLWFYEYIMPSNARKTPVITFTPTVETVDLTFSSDPVNYKITSDGTSVAGKTVKAEKSKEYIFNVELTEAAKEKNKFEVLVDNGTVTTGENGNYTITPTTDTVVTVSVTPKTFTVKEPAKDDSFKYVAATANPVAYGESFTFYVTPADGYPAPKDVNITPEGAGTLSALSNGQYIITNITNNININVTAAQKNTHKVVLPDGAGYGYTAAFDECVENSFTYGQDASFTVTPETGYKVSSVTATVNSVTTSLTKGESGKYTVNVTGDVFINVAVQKEVCSVKYTYTDKDSTAYTVKEGAASAEFGSSYTFYVTPATGYSDPKVTVNDVETKPVNGTQYVIDIKDSNTTINIEPGTRHQYDIKLIGGDGDGFTYNYEGYKLKVNHGGNFVFDVILLQEYSNSTPIVSVDGTQITKNAGGKYEISNITANKTVTVSGVQKNTYRVTLKNGNGYKLETTYNTLVTSGDEFVFSVNVASGFGGNYNVVAKTSDEKPVEVIKRGTDYVVTVTAATEISVEDVEPLKFSVNTPVLDNAKFTAVTAGAEISYGGSYQFKVTANPGYRVQAVAVNGNAITPVNGLYTVSNVTSDLVFNIEIAENILTVNFVSNEKNHIQSFSKNYKYSDIGNALNETLNDCSIHHFAGWYNVNGSKAILSDLQSAVNFENAAITLNAKFELFSAEEAAKKLIELGQTERLVSVNHNAEDYYHITFRTLASFVEAAKNDPCVSDYVTVTAHGTLLSSTKLSDGTDNAYDFSYATVSNYLLNRSDRTSTAPIIAEKLDGLNFKMYNYYMNCDLKLGNVDGDNIGLGISSKKPDERVAAGWMELNILNTRVVIVSKPNS